jgi:hypothetical protein
VQLQLQLPASHIRPYVGGGIGTVVYLTQAGGRSRLNEAVSVAAGLRAPLGSRLGLRLEGRVRYWDPSSGFGFINGAGEVTGGLSVRF